MNKLLFISGFPGGGTDLTKTIVNAHPDAYINGEMPFLINIGKQGYAHDTKFSNADEINEFLGYLRKLDNWDNIENLQYDFSKDLEESGCLDVIYVLRAVFTKHESIVWGNKTPQNTENISRLYSIFPEAHFLIVTRDVRDVCLSWQKKWGKDMLGCAAKWAGRMKKGWQATQGIPEEQYRFIKFEALISQPEIVCETICAFLNIPFSTHMLEHQKYTDNIIDGKINYGQAIRPENKAKWKQQLPRKTVKRIEEIAFDTMNLLEYEVEYATGKRPISSWETSRAHGHDFLALLFVGNRSSKHNNLKHRLEGIVFEVKKQFLRRT